MVEGRPAEEEEEVDRRHRAILAWHWVAQLVGPGEQRRGWPKRLTPHVSRLTTLYIPVYASLHAAVGCLPDPPPSRHRA